MFKLAVLLFPFLIFLIFPDQANAGVSELDNPISFPSLGSIITKALPLIFGLVALLAVVVFSIGAVRYIASRGDAKAAEGARNTMTGSVIGLVIVLGVASLSGVFQTVFGLGFFGVDGPGGPFPIPAVVELRCAFVLATGSCIGNEYTSFGDLVTQMILIILAIGALIFFLIFLYSGIRYMLARGDEKAVSEARAALTNAFVGLLLLIGAIAIIRLIAELLFKAGGLVI